MRKIFIFLSIFFFSISLFSQQFSRKDSLRGELTTLRTCYDVTYYDLFVIVDEKERTLERSYNKIHFTAISDFDEFQVDLAKNMEILLVEFEGFELQYTREYDAVFIQFPKQ